MNLRRNAPILSKTIKHLFKKRMTLARD